MSRDHESVQKKSTQEGCVDLVKLLWASLSPFSSCSTCSSWPRRRRWWSWHLHSLSWRGLCPDWIHVRLDTQEPPRKNSRAKTFWRSKSPFIGLCFGTETLEILEDRWVFTR